MKIQNETAYKILIWISDLFFPPSATYQKDRYIARYGRPKKSKIFYSCGYHGQMVVLHGDDFYTSLKELNDTPFFKQMNKDIKSKGSFKPSDYGYNMQDL